jgi:heme/copper-type cytochrome/quinol oxidase subunit 3
MAAGVKHDYHLVDPSPWPLIGSVAATVMALGGIAWMKGMFGLPEGTSWLFFAGLAGVLFTMFGWWADVVKEANAGDHTPVVSIGLRYGMVLFIASEVMFFVAWFWIFFEAALFHGNRVLGRSRKFAGLGHLAAPKGIEAVPAFHLPLVNTLTLLLSGTTVTWAHHALQQATARAPRSVWLLTVLLGVLFTSIQAVRIRPHPRRTNTSSAAKPGELGPLWFVLLHGHRLPRLPRADRDHLPGGLPDPPDGQRLHRQAALRFRGGRLVLALRRRGLAVPVRLHLRDLRGTSLGIR